MNHLYFDNASSILYSKELLGDLIKDTNSYSNPHSLSKSSKLTTSKMNNVRSKILKYVNADEDKYTCIFTGGTTDSLKKIGEYFTWNNNTNYIYTIDNHTSVVGIREYALNKGSNVTIIDFNNDNEINKINELSILFRPECKNNLGDKINLFAMPAESNFSGKIYSRDYFNLIKKKYGNTIFLYDTAKYISSHNLDLSDNLIDFCVISFYKIFGYPTGLGALIVKKDSIKYLNKSYFGGGTVSTSSSEYDYVIANDVFYEWMEDGSPNYLSIISLENRLQIKVNSEYISKLTYYFYENIKDYTYSNGQKVFKIYECKLNYTFKEFCKNHGSIITFNLLKENGEYIGYKEFEEICVLNNISIRTGCLCNIGACHKYLNISFNEMKQNFMDGHTCSNNKDIINGNPTGAIRVSFGLINTIDEINIFLKFINENFLSINENFLSINENFLSINENFGCNKITITELNIYPIKSCQKQSVQKWKTTEYGLLYDREWSIIDSNNKIIRLKKCANLIHLIPYINLSENQLIIKYKNTSITIDINNTPKEWFYSGYIYNNNINKWLSDCLDISCKLIRSKPDASFTNDGELLLINELSVLDLNNRTNMNYSIDIFRPNVVINGIKEYSEDTILSIENINSKFIFKNKCKRCNMINVDEITGNVDSSEPLLTLSKYRRTNGNIYFGIIMSIEYSTELKIGDTFKITHQL